MSKKDEFFIERRDDGKYKVPETGAKLLNRMERAPSGTDLATIEAPGIEGRQTQAGNHP